MESVGKMTSETIKKYTRKIADANPTEIIVIVFEIAEIYLDDAIFAYKNNDIDGFTENNNKTKKCIDDLISSLDLQYDISKYLLNIYMFVNKELSMSVVKKDILSVTRIQAMLTKLKVAFEELSKQDTSGAVMGNAQEVYAGLTYGKGVLNESTNIQSNRGFTV